MALAALGNHFIAVVSPRRVERWTRKPPSTEWSQAATTITTSSAPIEAADRETGGMTCVVALVENGNVYMGADSAAVAGLAMTVRADKKIYRNGPMLIGFTDSYRMGQLLGYALDVPDRGDAELDQFMTTTFINAVRKCLTDGGYSKKENNLESGGTFIVGYEGNIFTVYGDYQVCRSVHAYAAVGCGDHLALGSLWSTDKIGSVLPQDRLGMALSAAEEFSSGVRRPFHIEVLGPTGYPAGRAAPPRPWPQPPLPPGHNGIRSES